MASWLNATFRYYEFADGRLEYIKTTSISTEIRGMVICNLYILIPRLGQNIWNWGIGGVGLSNEINQYSIQSSWFYGLWKIMMVAILAGQHLALIALVTFNFLSNLNHLFPFYSSLHAIVATPPGLHLVSLGSCSIEWRKCRGIANFWISVWNNLLC